MSNISQDDILQAYNRIKKQVHQTPVLTSTKLNGLSDAQIFFKCENLQKVGAFKARGALNAVLKLSDEEKSKGVATHSSGNHGQALAWAAATTEIKSYVVVPKNAPQVKKDAMQEYGAELTFCEPNLKARESELQNIVDRTGATVIHPYNDYNVITGQATASYEVYQQIKEPLDYILAPVGGGGLISGTCLTTHYFNPQTKVVGCEPTGADDAFRSLQKGEIVPSENPDTIADGLLTSLGDKTFPIIKQHISEILTVEDELIKKAMRLIMQRMKIVIEPSAAVPFACLLKNKEKFKNKKVAIILSGGNIQLPL
ncbi:MAG: threonine ammonia-lyase [Candidatus Cyclobacteriaceae bacterium M2_1C_046]